MSVLAVISERRTISKPWPPRRRPLKWIRLKCLGIGSSDKLILLIRKIRQSCHSEAVQKPDKLPPVCDALTMKVKNIFQEIYNEGQLDWKVPAFPRRPEANPKDFRWITVIGSMSYVCRPCPRVLLTKRQSCSQKFWAPKSAQQTTTVDRCRRRKINCQFVPRSSRFVIED